MCLRSRSTTKKLRRECRTRLQTTTYLRAIFYGTQVFCSFVVSFGYGKYHRNAAAARVKLCRADQVAHVFQYRQVQLVKRETLQTFFLISMTLTSLIIFKFA